MSLGRIRSVKPQFFVDERLGELDPCCRLTFIGLWCYADRNGRLKDAPREIKTLVLPYDDVDMNAVLANLAHQGLIVRYESQGIKCIHICKFLQHQQIRDSEVDFKLPPPPDSRKLPETSGNAPLEGKGKEGIGKETRDLTVSLSARAREDAPSAEREPKPLSRFPLAACEDYARSLKGIKSPIAFAKSIWRSGDDDLKIAAFLERTSEPERVEPSKPVSVDELTTLAAELERMGLHEQAKAVRAGLGEK